MPKAIAITAPRAAPEETPRVEPSASGFFSSPAWPHRPGQACAGQRYASTRAGAQTGYGGRESDRLRPAEQAADPISDRAKRVSQGDSDAAETYTGAKTTSITAVNRTYSMNEKRSGAVYIAFLQKTERQKPLPSSFPNQAAFSAALSWTVKEHPGAIQQPGDRAGQLVVGQVKRRRFERP
jgi:hypothetical protein